MPHQWWVYCEYLTMVSVSGLSFAMGAAAERSGAALLLIVNLASSLAIVLSAPKVPQMSLFWLDLVLAAGLLIITFRFSSLWLGAAMLLQSAILFGHALALGNEEISSYGFMLMNNLVSWLMYACLLGADVDVVEGAQPWRPPAARPSPGRSAAALRTRNILDPGWASAPNSK